MVYGIVKLHWGHGEPGEGTAFKINCPALISDEGREEITVREISRNRSEMALTEDDEDLMCELTSRVVAKAE